MRKLTILRCRTIQGFSLQKILNLTQHMISVVIKQCASYVVVMPTQYILGLTQYWHFINHGQIIFFIQKYNIYLIYCIVALPFSRKLCSQNSVKSIKMNIIRRTVTVICVSQISYWFSIFHSYGLKPINNTCT